MNRKEKNGSPSAYLNRLLSLKITQITTLSFPRQSIKTNNANSCNLAKLIYQGGGEAVWGSDSEPFLSSVSTTA